MTRIGVLLVAMGLFVARPAAAGGTVTIETNGIEIALPSGWAQRTKGTATIIAPTKFKGRAIEIVPIKTMPPSTLEAWQKQVGDKLQVTMVKEIERNGAKIVIAAASVKVGKAEVTIDMLAMPTATGAVIMMSFVAADQDPLLRKASAEVLLSARIAGPKMSVKLTAPTAKGVVGAPQNYVEGMGKLVPRLDELLLLPNPLPVKFESCGKVNAFYNPGAHTITMCHELYDHFVALFTKAGLKDTEVDEMARGAFTFTFFHEFGHALHGELGLAVTAKAEDAADELATIMLSGMGERGAKIAYAGARWFAIEAGGGRRMNFLDEHSVDAQRMGSIMCLLYGSNKAALASNEYMKELGFNDIRLRKCVRDYQQRYKAWNTLLAPYHRKAKKK